MKNLFRRFLRFLGYRRPFKGQQVLYSSSLVRGYLPEDRRFEMPILYRRRINLMDHDVEPVGGATLITGPSA